jgi:hypothetical protein
MQQREAKQCKAIEQKQIFSLGASGLNTYKILLDDIKNAL